jgi:hypothetical protein
VATVPADADALSFVPFPNALSGFVNDTYYLVTGYPGIFNTGIMPFLYKGIAVADTAGMNFYADFPRAGFWKINVYELELTAGRFNLHGFHRMYFL